MRSVFCLFTKPSRLRGVRRREVFSAQFDGGQSAAMCGTSIHLGCDVLERRVVLTASENDFDFSEGTITGYTGAGGDVEIPSTIGGVPVTSIGEFTFYRCSGLTSVKIPAGVTSIGNSAFEACSGLTSLKLPEGLTSIADYAFKGCSGLTSLTIPASVTSIGNYAFGGNTIPYLVRLFGRSHLKSVVFEGNAPAVGSDSFWGAAGAKAYRDPRLLGYGSDGDNFYGLIVASSPDSLLFDAYGEITGLSFAPAGQSMSSRVVIPETINGKPVTSIGANAFRNLGLTNVVIPATVTKIGDGAFADNPGLRSIVIGNRVRTIGANAFSRDTSLETVKIGSRVISIGANAFADDTALKSVTFTAKAPTVGADAFKNVPFGAKAVRAAALPGYGPNGNLWNGLIVWTPGVVVAPTVTVSTANLAQNAASFTINGKGFVAGKPSAHQVTFSNGAEGMVMSSTATKLTVMFTKQPTSTGALTAIVTSVGGKSGVARQVATVIALPL